MSKIIKQTLEKEDALARGRELVQKIKALLKKRQLPSHQQVLKWDRNQPRGPKGSATGGQWVKGVSAGLGSMPGSMEPPAPGMEKGKGRADYADILNAPTGEGFRNRPRGVGIPEPVETSYSTKTLEALEKGTVKDSRPLGSGGANASVIVTLEDGTEAVYKPERGENWTASFTNHDISRFITNREFSLAEREAFAFEVDTALGLGLVPETVLRTRVDETNINVNTSGDDDGGGYYDSYEARQEYDEYKEKAQEDAIDAVGEEMGQLFDDAQKEHVKDIENRMEEVKEIWEEEREAFPDVGPYGSETVQRAHAKLPLGSQQPFERGELTGDEINPLELLDDAGVDVSSGMSSTEKDRVREILRKKLQEGVRAIGEVDEDDAREHLDRDKWIEDHQDTEARMYESKIQSFDAWRRSHGYGSDQGGGGSGEDRNPDAPHPRGGSFQHFRDGADSWGHISKEDGAKLAVLDYVIGTMDRHGNNLMFEDNKAIAIDNGYSMPAARADDNFTFRSSGVDSWLSSGDSRNVPPELRAQLHEGMQKTDWQALVDRHPSMNEKERRAFLGRVQNMTIALQTEEGLRELWRDLNRI